MKCFAGVTSKYIKVNIKKIKYKIDRHSDKVDFWCTKLSEFVFYFFDFI